MQYIFQEFELAEFLASAEPLSAQDKQKTLGAVSNANAFETAPFYYV